MEMSQLRVCLVGLSNLLLFLQKSKDALGAFA
jgi:hypothetical protein